MLKSWSQAITFDFISFILEKRLHRWGFFFQHNTSGVIQQCTAGTEYKANAAVSLRNKRLSKLDSSYFFHLI